MGAVYFTAVVEAVNSMDVAFSLVIKGKRIINSPTKHNKFLAIEWFI